MVNEVKSMVTPARSSTSSSTGRATSATNTGPTPRQADARVAREAPCRLLRREVGRRARLEVDAQRRAPLGEARALLVELLAAREELVEARAPRLARQAALQRLEARVDLDAGDDAVLLQHVDERLAVRVVLEERLLEEDRARDVFADVRGREEQVAPGAAVVLRVLEANRLEALADRARRLVARE